MATYDLTEIVDQRREAIGSDRVEFTYGGETFSIVHPLFADDDFKDGLADVETDVDMAVYYLGDEQYERFAELGGRSGFIGMLLAKVQADAVEADKDGNPTRSRQFSNRAQRRQKQR